MSEEVVIGFSIPGTVITEVDDPEDVQECIKAAVDEISQMDGMELTDMLQFDMVGENIHYVDGEDGEPYHEW